MQSTRHRVRSKMSAEDHPLHSQELQPAAADSPPAVDVDQEEEVQPLQDLDLTPVRPTTFNMNFIISYTHGPPFVTWWSTVPVWNLPNYPPPQRTRYGRVNPWNIPPVHQAPIVFTYCSPAVLAVPEPSYFQPKLNQLQPTEHKVQGSSKQIKNHAPEPHSLPMKSVCVQEESGVFKAFLPGMSYETAFPELPQKKEDYFQIAMNVPPFQPFVGPRSLRGVKSTKDVQNITPNSNKISNCDGLDEQQNNNNSVDPEKEKIISGLLEMVLERKHPAKENVETDHTATTTGKNPDYIPKKTNQAAGYQRNCQWMISRSSWTFANMLPTSPININLRDPNLYRYMLRYIPSKIWLDELGYPCVSFNNRKETIIFKKQHPFTTQTKKNYKRDKIKLGNKLCDRCGATFVMKTGKKLFKDKCVYHWGKIQIPEDFNVHMTCCKLPPTSPGCTTAKSHVWNGLHDGINAGLKGFQRTSAPPNYGATSKIFGLDCEMCFTTQGLELVKVALVDLAGNQVYYSLVIPQSEIVDFNTRFSGVSEKDIKDPTAQSFRKVQEEVLKFIKSDTIIIGHGLENDLRALKIIHPLVVDTSIVYPHPHGFPFRRSLKDIAEEVLKKKIQESNHNPVEDANVCVELILKQLKKDFNIQITP